MRQAMATQRPYRPWSLSITPMAPHRHSTSPTVSSLQCHAGAQHQSRTPIMVDLLSREYPSCRRRSSRQGTLAVRRPSPSLVPMIPVRGGSLHGLHRQNFPPRRASKHVTRLPDCSDASTAVKGFCGLNRREKISFVHRAGLGGKHNPNESRGTFFPHRGRGTLRGKPVQSDRAVEAARQETAEKLASFAMLRREERQSLASLIFLLLLLQSSSSHVSPALRL